MRCVPYALPVLATVSVLLGACGASTTWTGRGPKKPPRAADCAFDVYSTRRAPRNYTILGVLDIAAFSVRALPKSDAELRPVVAKEVCRVGGDAALAGINGDGRYVFATVVKYADARQPTPEGSAP